MQNFSNDSKRPTYNYRRHTIYKENCKKTYLTFFKKVFFKILIFKIVNRRGLGLSVGDPSPLIQVSGDTQKKGGLLVVESL